MRQLLQLLLRFGGFFLFVLLEGLCFYLVVNFNQRQNQIYLSSSSALVGGLYEQYENAIDYLNLKDQIKNLMEENAKLRRQLPNAQYPPAQKSDTIEIVKQDTIRYRYEYIPAKVINNSIVGSNNLLTVDKGSKAGVKPHMGVIGRSGIVGIVRNVGTNYSSVMSVLHSQTRISASIKRSGYFGSLIWKDENNPQYMQLEAIPKHASIEKGDTVQTSGYSIFPEGIIIGIVEDRIIDPGDNFYKIKVKLINDLSRVKHAYIVKDLEVSEIGKLKELEADE